MSDLTLLETDRLVLAGWRPEQIGDLYRLHGDDRVARYLTAHGRPWTKAEMDVALAHWIELFERHRMGKLRVVRKSDGALVGRAGYGIYPPTGEPELGYSLYPEHWGNGYAFEAARALRDWLFSDTDWDHFIGIADVRNEASLKVLRRIGMRETHVGQNADGHHCQWFVLNRPAAA